MKIAIVYASHHRGNTRKLVRGISESIDILCIDAEQQHRADLSGFDLIGFASGIDFGKFYDAVETFLKENLPPDKSIFFLYTCARTSSRFTKTVRESALQKDATIVGEYGCRGYNTYGPWKVIGGMNKMHPTDAEIREAIAFLKSIL